MIIITGAAEITGSSFVSKLNNEGFNDLILVDDFSDPQKNRNLEGKRFSKQIDYKEVPDLIRENQIHVQFVFQLRENKNDQEYDKTLWNLCIEFGLPFVYTSSDENEFEEWALQQERKPYFCVFLKHPVVYGPNEYYKGNNASSVYNLYQAITETAEITLTNAEVNLVYSKDVAEALYFLLHNRKHSGVYFLKTEEANSLENVALAIFAALDKKEAKVSLKAVQEDKNPDFKEEESLSDIGFNKPLHTLKEGIADYVKNYLITGRYL